ncbi:metalloprotease TIKI1 isoform X5 [Ochotona princeps]|uniref:metalloprotease TIKI1 isoform X5 n=1 Tax=Ochotona princeps TaxID=9978 RepID=UPI002714C50E|nr:metalloprotease TIKI1 isoform X5 [Ochotona princeps]
MSPWSWFLLPTLCLLPTDAVPRREAPTSANCKLKPQQSHFNSFLWTIKRDPPSYFFGTIHVPYTRVWDFIPDHSKEAFQRSSAVYLELDLTDPDTLSALASCQMLPQGGHLQDVLPSHIYHRLKRHLEYVKLMLPSWMTPDQRGQGLYADYLFNAIAGNWERKRPVWVMLMVNSLTEVDIKSRGAPVLDLFLAQEAERLRKPTGAVEKVEEQCHPFNRLNFSQVPNFINATLRPQERITAQEIDSYFRRELIYKRNERMGKRVMALLEQFPDKGFFFAFGAGHFLGNHSVLDVLRREGYEVEHAPAGRPLNKEKSKKPSSLPAPSSLIAPEVLTPEALAPEAGVAARAPLPFHVSPPAKVGLPGEEEHRFQKKRRWPPRKQPQRQFSDLWVRLEESTAIPVLDKHVSTELQLPPHSPMVASSARLSLCTPALWVWVLAFPTETRLF